MIDSSDSENKKAHNAISKITTKILDGFRRKEKTTKIFFDIKKAYEKVNRDKTLEQLENMGRMLEFIRKLIGEKWITKQTDRFGNSTSVTIFLVAIHDILKKLGNGVDGSLFADNLTIYITTKNQRVAARALQGVTNKLDAWAVEKALTFFPNKTVSTKCRKRNEEPIKIMLRIEILYLLKIVPIF